MMYMDRETGLISKKLYPKYKLKNCISPHYIGTHLNLGSIKVKKKLWCLLETKLVTIYPTCINTEILTYQS